MRNVAARSLEGGAKLVLEANFHRDESAPWLKELVAMASQTRIVICRTTIEENRRRFAARRRHPVHLDREILDDWPPNSEFELELGMPSLAVDTTSGYRPDLEAILRFIA